MSDLNPLSQKMPGASPGLARTAMARAAVAVPTWTNSTSGSGIGTLLLGGYVGLPRAGIGGTQRRALYLGEISRATAVDLDGDYTDCLGVELFRERRKARHLVQQQRSFSPFAAR